MKIIAFPHKSGSGGPGSFQTRFEEQLKKLGYKVTYAGRDEKPDLVFIVGGTKKMSWLIKCKLKGIPVIYRLDGINWLHRKRVAGRSLKLFYTSEVINLLSRITHAFLADYIVYQSEFVQKWWDRKGFVKRKNYSIIHNGVDIEEYKPAGGDVSNTLSNIVCLEGLLDYSPFAIDLINYLHSRYGQRLVVYGGIKFKKERDKLNPEVNYKGEIAREETKNAYRGAIYLSLDVHPACPNTVVEALASGAPVVGFDTGAVKELVPEHCGKIVPYGSDAWELGYPDVAALEEAIKEVSNNFAEYSKNAREYAEENYSVDLMTEKYLKLINSKL